LKKKRTITIEELETGKLRVTVDGPPYIVGDSNLSSREVTPSWLLEFAPGPGQSRQKYSSQDCTGGEDWHRDWIGTTTCDGICHDHDCVEPAAFFVYWLADDGRKQCMPYCKWHASGTASRLGRVMLNALDYGVTVDLLFWTEQDVLPGGKRRCDNRYYAVDRYEDFEEVRCTQPATKIVKVTPRDGNPYEARVCDRCAKSDSDHQREVVREIES
jgi:hypothetical protein